MYRVSPAAVQRRRSGGAFLARGLNSSVGQIRSTALLIYLFRADGSQNFAYSLDVTGRNIPPVKGATWIFQRTVDAEQLKAHPEALRQVTGRRLKGRQAPNGC